MQMHHKDHCINCNCGGKQCYTRRKVSIWLKKTLNENEAETGAATGAAKWLQNGIWSSQNYPNHHQVAPQRLPLNRNIAIVVKQGWMWIHFAALSASILHSNLFDFCSWFLFVHSLHLPAASSTQETRNNLITRLVAAGRVPAWVSDFLELPTCLWHGVVT